MSIEEHRDDIETCFGTSCNFCERNCPVYKILRIKTYTSKGKNRAMLGLIDGHYDASMALAEVAFTCTLCGACDAHCALPNTERFIELRRKLVKEGLIRPEYDLAIESIKRTGDVFGRSIETSKIFEETADGEVPVYLGCQYKGNKNEVKLIIKVLDKMGIKAKITDDESCCGYIAHVLGYEDEMPEIVSKFKEAYPHDDFITLCPSCTMFTQEEMDLNSTHVVKRVHELIMSGKVKLKNLDMDATYHDPCDLGRKLGVIEEPREILEAMGVRVHEMENNKEFSMCCGAGGGMLITDPELVEDMSKQRMKQAIDTGVDVLVTVCPTCESTLLTGSMLARKEYKKRVKVMSLWELLDEALE